MSPKERKKDISPQIVLLIVQSHQIFKYTSQTTHIEDVKCYDVTRAHLAPPIPTHQAGEARKGLSFSFPHPFPNHL